MNINVGNIRGWIPADPDFAHGDLTCSRFEGTRLSLAQGFPFQSGVGMRLK